MTIKRTKALGLATTLAALPFLIPGVAAAQSGQTGSGDEGTEFDYPAVTECVDGQRWQWDWAQPSLSRDNPTIVMEGFSVPAGHAVTISEVLTWDQRQEWETDTEGNEQLRIDFYNGGVLVASSPQVTQDLPDGTDWAWAMSGLGSVDLPDGADEIRIAHASTFMTTDDTANALIVKNVCLTVEPLEVTEPPVTEPPVTEPPVTEPPVTEPPVTEPPVTEVPTEVLPQTEVADRQDPGQQQAQAELAFTGAETTRNLGLGAGLLAVGSTLLAMSRRRRGEV